jgi:hypothetical protein
MSATQAPLPKPTSPGGTRIQPYALLSGLKDSASSAVRTGGDRALRAGEARLGPLIHFLYGLLSDLLMVSGFSRQDFDGHASLLDRLCKGLRRLSLAARGDIRSRPDRVPKMSAYPDNFEACSPVSLHFVTEANRLVFEGNVSTGRARRELRRYSRSSCSIDLDWRAIDEMNGCRPGGMISSAGHQTQ